MSGHGHSPCGRSAPCIECSETKPIRGNGRCSTCYQRKWNQERRHAPRTRTERIKSAGQHKLYPQAIVRVEGVKGWGFL